MIFKTGTNVPPADLVVPVALKITERFAAGEVGLARTRSHGRECGNPLLPFRWLAACLELIATGALR